MMMWATQGISISDIEACMQADSELECMNTEVIEEKGVFAIWLCKGNMLLKTLIGRLKDVRCIWLVLGGSGWLW